MHKLSHMGFIITVYNALNLLLSIFVAANTHNHKCKPQVLINGLDYQMKHQIPNLLQLCIYTVLV